MRITWGWLLTIQVNSGFWWRNVHHSQTAQVSLMYHKVWKPLSSFYVPYRTQTKELPQPLNRSSCFYFSLSLHFYSLHKRGFFFKSKSARVTSLLKTLQGLLMFLHDHKSWIILHFTFPTTLPSPLLRLPAASSHTWPPETEPLLPIGSVCPDGFPADTCVACYCTSLEVWLQNHL